MSAFGALVLVWQLLLTAFAEPMGPSALGFVLGVGVSSSLWIAWVVVTSLDGSSPWRAGSQGEGFTGDVLAKLSEGWSVFHHVPFTEGPVERSWQIDVDHVAVGPTGVLVIETKCTTASIDLSRTPLDSMVKNAATQSLKNVGRMRALLSREGQGVEFIPLVVVWGNDVTPPHEPVLRIGEARIVAGADSDRWLPLIRQSRIDESRRAAIAGRIATHMLGQDARSLGHRSHADQVASLSAKAEKWSMRSLGLLAGSIGLFFVVGAVDALATGFTWLISFGNGFGAFVFVFGPIVPAGIAASFAWRVWKIDAPPPIRWPLTATLAWTGAVAALFAIA